MGFFIRRFLNEILDLAPTLACLIVFCGLNCVKDTRRTNENEDSSELDCGNVTIGSQAYCRSAAEFDWGDDGIEGPFGGPRKARHR
jgi:hypothetical protein